MISRRGKFGESTQSDQWINRKKKIMSAKYLDTSFDVRTDSKDRDPDTYSSTLRGYHKVLWSKELPNGELFIMEDTKKRAYLYHNSSLGEFYLSSDSIVHTYFKWDNMQHIIRQIPKEDMDYFYSLAHTIAGYILFPGNRVNGQNTINQARGVKNTICDRFDLTLECIRRFYFDEASPLKDTIKRYSSFFRLYANFRGYCEFFLLQDLVTPDFSQVVYFLPFTDFVEKPLPKTVEEYTSYMKANIEFLTKRNRRILEWSSQCDRK